MPGRTRDISPGFFLNENWPNPLAQILFAGLLCYADREGRLEDRPKRLKPLILPNWDCDVEGLLSALCPEFISRYRVGDSRYIQIRKFVKHQKHIHARETESEIPPEDTEGLALGEPKANLRQAKVSPDTHDTSSSSSSSSSKKGVQGETNGEITQDRFEKFWQAFPAGRKKSKAAARKAWMVAIKKCNPEVLIAGAREYAASNEGRGKFVKMPSTWLNGECWADDRGAWAANQSEPPTSMERKQAENEAVAQRMRQRLRRQATPLLEEQP